jgi:TetR/AcrR family transcriptional regulator
VLKQWEIDEAPLAPVTENPATEPAWIDRAAERSPAVQRSRERTIAQAKQIVEAAEHLLETQGGQFTTQQLVKEAGVALQTFYRYFAGKDELLLAVLEDVLVEGSREMARVADAIADPAARLRFFVTRPIDLLETNPGAIKMVTAEHWRLFQLYPDDVARTTQHFSDLLEPEIEAATRAGVLTPGDPKRDAAMITTLVMAVVHDYAFIGLGESAEAVCDHLWRFCLGALGGTPPTVASAE